jgi:ParB family chromosome partitioning protein
MAKQTFGLGRGLGSLIPKRGAKSDRPVEPIRQSPKASYFSTSAFATHPIEESVAHSQIIELPIADIVSNRHQPRQYFDDVSMQELAASIATYGILQPLVVVKNDSGDGYELIAGERRLRAARMANLKTVPVIVREASDLERLELALIENIQRADLNLIEEAEAYKKLNDEFGLTHEQIAERVGKSRPVVSNIIRLLTLPAEIQQAIAEGKITEGHAKVLLEIKDAEKRLALFRQVLQQKLSITDTSHEVKRIQVRTHQRRIWKDPNLVACEEELCRALGTKVTVRRLGKSAGAIVIEYYGDEELRALVEKLVDNR